MEQAFNLKEMFLLGWPILSVLLAASIISVAIIFERWRYFKKHKVAVKEYFNRLPEILKSGKRETYETLGQPMSTITQYAVTHVNQSADSLELAVDRAIRLQVADMERYVPFLGTIAATAPFMRQQFYRVARNSVRDYPCV